MLNASEFPKWSVAERRNGENSDAMRRGAVRRPLARSSLTIRDMRPAVVLRDWQRIAEKDARGNTTEYTVDEETSRNEVVTDRCGNKTEYEYDETDMLVAYYKYVYDSQGNIVRSIDLSAN